MRGRARPAKVGALLGATVLWVAILALPAWAAAPNVSSFFPMSGTADTTVVILGGSFTGATTSRSTALP
jgi:hypothetical protein